MIAAAFDEATAATRSEYGSGFFLADGNKQQLAAIAAQQKTGA